MTPPLKAVQMKMVSNMRNQRERNDGMRDLEVASRLRVYVGQNAKVGHRPVYEAIVSQAKKSGLSGATVIRGMMGFGGSGVLHTSKILCLSENLPMVVEIVDTPERIESFVKEIDGMIQKGMAIIEKVRVIAYRHNGSGDKANA